MARIQQTKNTAIPAWKVSWHDGEMSRSKAIRDHDDAIKFKALVEDHDDNMPPLAVLNKHGLIQYGEWINPAVVVGILELLDHCENDEEAVRQVRQILDLIVNVPR